MRDGPGPRRLVRAVHLQREADASTPVGAEADDDDLIGIAREDLPPMGDVAHAIGHARDGRVQVQLAAVVGRTLVAGEVQPQVAEGLVGFLSDRIAEELLSDERHGLADLAFEHQPPDLVPMAAGPLTHVIVRPPRPEGVLVELDALVRRPSEDHRPEAPAADRQGFLPGTRRLRIPEPQVSGPGIGRGARASGQERRRQDQHDQTQSARHVHRSLFLPSAGDELSGRHRGLPGGRVERDDGIEGRISSMASYRPSRGSHWLLRSRRSM